MGVQFAGNILATSAGGPLPIAMGGTGQTSAVAAINALLPSQTGQTDKILKTDGTNVSWVAAPSGNPPGGSDTQIQFNDSGSFGGLAALTINKSTGAVTSTSTFKSVGEFISNSNGTDRYVTYQTAGVDRWLMGANAAAESTGNAGSNFELVRVSDNGSTTNQVFTISRATGVVDFKVSPTVNGSAIGAVTSVNAGTNISVSATSGDVTVSTSTTPSFSTVTSTVATGTAPFTVTSTTPVANLSIGGNAATATTATTATNISGGSAGQLLYQSGANTTAKVTVGSNGDVLTLSGGIPTWSAAAGGGVTLSDDTSTNATYYPSFATATSGTASTIKVSSTKLTFNPSTGTLTSTAMKIGSLSVGYLEVPQVSGTSGYTCVLSDSGKHIYTSSGGITWNIPANSSVAYPVGTAITFVNQSTSNVTIAITSDTMYLAGTAGTTGSRTLGQYGVATALKVASTTWIISGTSLT